MQTKEGKEMEHLIDNIISKYMEENYFPSAVCKIFSTEETYYHKAFGNVQADTIYDVASLSKIITSTEILMLINDGKISLNGKIIKYLPIINEFKVLSERLKGVTIEQLLTHNSGLIDWYPFYTEEGTIFKVMNEVIGKYDKFNGTLYSDLNFMLLAEIIKSTAGLSLEESLEKYIKQRLNIKNICYCPSDKSNIAPTSYGNCIEEKMCMERNVQFGNWRSHDTALAGEVNDGNAHYFFKGVSGHAGIFADVNAYADLCRYYMTSSDELIKSSMKEHGEGRGLGWQISESFPMGCGHSGFTGTSVYICKDINVAVVTFTNRLHTKGEAKDLFNFRKELHNCILNILKKERN